MVKGLLAIGSFLVGGAGLGVIAYMQSNPMAFVRQPPAPITSTTVSRRIEPMNDVVSVDPAGSLRTDEEPAVEKRAPRSNTRRAEVPAAEQPSADPPADPATPCGGWRGVGVHYVGREGAGVGQRAVRELCN